MTFLRMLCIIGASLIIGRVNGAWSAQPTREEFTGAMNGWTNTGGITWRATNGYAQATFSASLTPATAVLSASGQSSSGSFTGDYRAAEVALIGFSFRAEQVLPSDLTIRLTSGTNGYFRSMQNEVLQTGVWYRFYLNLIGKEDGGWSGDDTSLFDPVLSNIQSVAISVTKPATMAASSFRVDDILIDRLHQAGAPPTVSATDMAMHWDHLQSNGAYRLDVSTNLMDGWTLLQWVVATNASIDVHVSREPHHAAWRLILP